MEAMTTIRHSQILVCTEYPRDKIRLYKYSVGAENFSWPSHSFHKSRSRKLHHVSCGRSSVEALSSSRGAQKCQRPYSTFSTSWLQAVSPRPSTEKVLPLWIGKSSRSLKWPGSCTRRSKLKNVIQASNMEVATSAEEGIATAESNELRAELRMLLDLVPHHLRDRLQDHEEIEQLVEIVLDLGRKPMARFPSGDWFISQDTVTSADLEHAVSLVGEFADDNRAGMDRTLHRISAIRNRAGRIVGLTCRVGRAISGCAEMVRDLVAGGGSLLLMGPPGVGKTTAIREVARMLANEYQRRVVIVDTSNEIAGDGDIPHVGIGRARRMQVPRVELQHKVMIEAVENHMPQTIVIDEIGTELEALAAGTIAQRGVQLVGTAHGMTVENLVKNPSLQILAGGIQSVTLGDEEARRRNVQKSVLERKGPPTFTAAVEMVSRNEWKVHKSLAATVDYLLAGRPPKVEYRKMNSEGKLIIGNKEAESTSGVRSPGSQFAAESVTDDESDEDDYDSDDDEAESPIKGRQAWDSVDTPLYLYTYQVTEASLEQVMEVMGLENSVQITNDIGAADVVLALRSKLKQNAWVRGMAKYRQLPVFAIKANTMAQMVRAMRAILGMESLAANTLVTSNRLEARNRIEEQGGLQSATRKATSEDEIDALEEARLAIEQLVIPKGQPVELLPRTPDIIALQIKLVEGYQLATEKAGTEFNVRLRILPRVTEGGMYEGGKRDDWDEEANLDGGKSVVRLPILPD
ncbi:hypothetical protein MPTK1_5g22990 [Marchantia polymorpha subsp. ruderalis]|uniref:AAA+ ATPase domain-containing protein n=3 Tax=Marchantia polymorpha TaxID=3197 RepID=A0AAF6BLB7_MARPO|nr:hypothetical protein MARPO_0010s0157 [Marchantia polymorpha]PTQ46778.1 hypothetical protein MARPO_0010s0157 [Marchantia polymorpha]BBN12800.1 hypothetical protein Mp_5g22990 [Marchantia polymorpha subsp. ruderalis]BBN12801.1 hypothetical protein Mp_5g22990 [Marchantia polymorpha subsp. ruderalis]|eukprot:PTQ46776.1 hypothetical protein MARPO_0010s0157 [Marchantia polymorpha]